MYSIIQLSGLDSALQFGRPEFTSLVRHLILAVGLFL